MRVYHGDHDFVAKLCCVESTPANFTIGHSDYIGKRSMKRITNCEMNSRENRSFLVSYLAQHKKARSPSGNRAFEFNSMAERASQDLNLFRLNETVEKSGQRLVAHSQVGNQDECIAQNVDFSIEVQVTFCVDSAGCAQAGYENERIAQNIDLSVTIQVT